MNSELGKLQPDRLWNIFAEICRIPRASTKEQQIRAYIQEYVARCGLRAEVDGAGNVLVRKPATSGMHDRQTTALQAHLDMVQQQAEATVFDFKHDPIRPRTNGNYVQACGTTLGADNGIGVAAILALLSSTDIPHPPLEALFTVDEETGMTGAKALDQNWLTARILLNLDSEDVEEFAIGSAGGIQVIGSGAYSTESSGASTGWRVGVTGLAGGHSGMDIHRGRANANKLLNRVLCRAVDECGARLATLRGGGLSNAIPREAFADLTIPAAQAAHFESSMAEFSAMIRAEYATTDPGMQITIESIEPPARILESDFQSTLVRAIQMCPNGIHRMSPEVPGLVQSSNNLARLRVEGGSFAFHCLCRSSVDSEKRDLVVTIRYVLESTRASVRLDSDFPGWTPRPTSRVVELLTSTYRDLFGYAPRVVACHAGLECGIIGGKYPRMELISFGPTILDAHSPDERVEIGSVQKFWTLLLATLRQIPETSS